MFRQATVAVRPLSAALLLAVLLGACGGAGPEPAEPAPPALAQATTGTSEPPASAGPTPPVPEACPVLGAATVGEAFGLPAPKATEDDSAAAATGKVHMCDYRFADGAQYVQLWISVQPQAGTAEQHVNRAIGRYSGSLEPVQGVGDAALYSGGVAPASLVAARVADGNATLVTLISFVSASGPDQKEQLTTLARAALERV